MTNPLLVEIRMVRETLMGVPVYPIRGDFSIRRYRSGDQVQWLRIQQEAERYHAMTQDCFTREFGVREADLTERQLFVCDAGGREVGTATAWFGDSQVGAARGRIHWVAVSEEFQGRGLGRSLISAACQRLIELGHRSAYLTTESVRLTAIKMYIQFGFRPEIRNEIDLREWEALRDRGLSLPWSALGPTAKP